MIVARNLSETDPSRHSVVTIGTFDGVHLGHKKIIERLIASARANNLQSTILTFFPHPRMVLQQAGDLKLLNTIEEKTEILRKTGLERLIIHPFTKEFSRLTAETYVKEVLVDRINAKKVIIGYDHRFGRNRTATFEDLRIFGERFGFEVEQITAREVDEVSVSSTKIRKALHEGDITTANKYLGYPYMLNGNITRGKGLGRQLDFPTANLHIPQKYKLIPGNGVYVVQCQYEGKLLRGMMNIGTNPTVNGKEQSLEVHLFRFDGDLYGKKIEVQLLHRLRDEVRFNSLEELKSQLHLDRENAQHYFEHESR